MMTANGLEQQIAAYLKTLAESAVNSGSDFNQGVVRGLEIAAAQFEHGHAKNHVPSLALLDEAERVVEALYECFVKRGPFDEPLGESEQAPSIGAAAAFLAKLRKEQDDDR